jgi:hypothetical protein
VKHGLVSTRYLEKSSIMADPLASGISTHFILSRIEESNEIAYKRIPRTYIEGALNMTRNKIRRKGREN